MSEPNVVATIPVKAEHVETIRGAFSELAAPRPVTPSPRTWPSTR